METRRRIRSDDVDGNDVAGWNGLVRLQVPHMDIIDWSAVLYKGPGKVAIYPNNLNYRPFHILITGNHDHSVLKIQRFECRSVACGGAFGRLAWHDRSGTSGHEYPNDHVVLCGFFPDSSNVIRDEGTKRAERHFSTSKVTQPLVACGLSPLKNSFQIEFSTTTQTQIEKITLQMCDDEAEDGTSLFMQHIAKHMKNRHSASVTICPEWEQLTEIVPRISSRLLYNPLVCMANGISFIQPDGLFEELVLATAPDLTRKILGYTNPYLCILGYRKEKLLCIQVFHSVQSRIFCHEHPDKKSPKHELWIGCDDGLSSLIRLIRIYQVIEAGGDGTEYSKRITAFDVRTFLMQGHLPTDRDRTFLLPIGDKLNRGVEFSFSHTSCVSVGYSKYAAKTGNIFEYITSRASADSCQHKPVVPDTTDGPVIEEPRDEGKKLVQESFSGDKQFEREEKEFAHEERELERQEPERWAWFTQPTLSETFIDFEPERSKHLRRLRNERS